ncbi:MAG: hypothetical protein ABFD62_13790 [Syntrophaceae bacterium]
MERIVPGSERKAPWSACAFRGVGAQPASKITLDLAKTIRPAEISVVDCEGGVV